MKPKHPEFALLNTSNYKYLLLFITNYYKINIWYSHHNSTISLIFRSEYLIKYFLQFGNVAQRIFFWSLHLHFIIASWEDIIKDRLWFLISQAPNSWVESNRDSTLPDMIMMVHPVMNHHVSWAIWGHTSIPDQSIWCTIRVIMVIQTLLLADFLQLINRNRHDLPMSLLELRLKSLLHWCNQNSRFSNLHHTTFLHINRQLLAQ